MITRYDYTELKILYTGIKYPDKSLYMNLLLLRDKENGITRDRNDFLKLKQFTCKKTIKRQVESVAEYGKKFGNMYYEEKVTPTYYRVQVKGGITLLEAGVSPLAVLVYYFIHTMYEQKYEKLGDESFWMLNPAIAEHLQVSEGAVAKAITELKKFKVLQVKNAIKNGNKRRFCKPLDTSVINKGINKIDHLTATVAQNDLSTIIASMTIDTCINLDYNKLSQKAKDSVHERLFELNK